MSSQEEEETQELPTIDFALQHAVYALMGEANVKKYHTYEVGEWSGTIKEIWRKKKKKKDQNPSSEPAEEEEEETQENERKKKENHQEPRIEQEDQIAALMLLTYVAIYIQFSKRLHRYNEKKKHSTILPVKKRHRVDLNDLANAAWHEHDEHRFDLESFIEKLYYDTKSQIEFLKILTDYMNKKNKNPSTNPTALSEFIKDWVSDDASVTDLSNAIDFLKREHQERLKQVERSFYYWDEDEQMVFHYTTRIWGSKVDVDSHVTDELNEHSRHLDVEYTIFERVVLYKEKNGRNPFPDKNDLADFTKNWLRIGVRVEEFNELMNHLRKKYVKRAGRRPFLNVNYSSTKAEKVIELALMIWGW